MKGKLNSRNELTSGERGSGEKKFVGWPGNLYTFLNELQSTGALKRTRGPFRNNSKQLITRTSTTIDMNATYVYAGQAGGRAVTGCRHIGWQVPPKAHASLRGALVPF